MTENRLLKTSLRVWLRMVFATFLCFIVWASVYAMSTALFSDTIGYRIYEQDENGENNLVVEHFYTEDEDKSAEIPLEENQSMIGLRELSDETNVKTGVVSSAFTLVIFGAFPYNILWNIGSKDNNLVTFNRMKKDIFFGLKVGCVANIPSAVLYLLLVLGKFGVVPGVVLKWHRVLNTPFIPYIDGVEQGAEVASQLTIGSLLAVGATLLFVPIISQLGYYLGYRQISVRERLVYKKPNAKE